MFVKRSRKVFAIAVVLLFVLSCLASLYLRTDSFQEFARARLISAIERSTGLECRIARSRINALLGRIEIAGLELEPKTAAPGLVSLKVSEIRSRISVSSFWNFRVRLADLNIVHPQVEVLSGGSGKKDSSWEPEGILKSLKLSLRLEASKVTVLNGRLKINGRENPFNLSLRDLDCEIRFAKEIPGYRIHLEYSRSRVFWERREIRHDLALDANLSLREFAVEYFRISRGGTLLTGSGSVRNWKYPTLRIHAAGTLDSGDLILAHPSINEGRGKIGIVADLKYDREGVYSRGSFSAHTGSYRKLTYADLKGNYEILHDVLKLREVSGRVGNGSFLIDGDIQLRDANEAPNLVRIRTRNVSLTDSGKFLRLPLINFENTADATTKLTWYAGQVLKVECNANLHGLPDTEDRAGKGTLLGGNLQFTYYDSGAVLVSSASLKSPYTTVKASGGEGSVFRVRLFTDRISEPLDLIAGFSTPVAEALEKYPDLLRMRGAYDLDGSVRVKSASDIDYRGSIRIRHGSWRSYKIDSLSTRAYFSFPQLKLQSLEASRGAQSIRGRLDLDILKGEQVSNFRFEGSVRNLALGSIQDYGIDIRSTGALNGNGSIQYDSSGWRADGRILVEKGSYDGEPFDRLQAQVQLENLQLRVSRAEIARGPARLSAEGNVNLRNRKIDLSARLVDLPLESIPVVRRKKLPVQGRINASGTLTGTVERPDFFGSFELGEWRYDSWHFRHGSGRLNFENGNLRGSAFFQSDFGEFNLEADLATARGLPGKIGLRFENLNIRKIVPGEIPPYLREISTALKGSADIEGAFADFSTLKVNGELDGARCKIQNYELRNSGQVRFALMDGSFRLENVEVVGQGTSLILNGTIPLDDSRNLEMDLKGRLNLQSLEGMDRKLHVAGGAALDIRASGTKQSPEIIGRASFQDVTLEYPALPFHFSSMRGSVVFSRNLVRLENIRGAASSGNIQLSGIIEHQNAKLRSMNVGISVRNARISYPEDFRSVVDSDLVLNGNHDVQILTGDVHVLRAEYVRSFNLLDQLTSRGAAQPGPLTTTPYLLGLRLNVDIHSDNGLLIDNELTKLRGSLRLTLRGTPAYPSLTGRVEANEGTIFFRGNRFEISHASADFVDRNRINPVLEIRAEADVKTYRLILDAVGDLDHLTMNVTSDPPMSTVDILSLLTTGKADTGTGTSDSKHESEMAGISAASVLSENLTGVLGKRVQRIFGLESFRVDPFLAGAENDPTARVTISERLAKNLVVTFSRNLTTNQDQIVIIEYNVSKDLSLVATRDEDGKYGLDFRLRRRLR